MTINYYSSYNELSRYCTESIISHLRINPRLLLCAATGYSPEGVYSRLAEACQKEPALFDQLTLIKLDEWGGMSPDNPHSCETFLTESLLGPLQISPDRYISFQANPDVPIDECHRVQRELLERGPIDICILGMGTNGHLGFNEPGDVLIPYCHVATLTDESKTHQMVASLADKPTYGLTLGMADILAAKHIMLLVTGSNKQKSFDQLTTKQVSTQLPASFLWLHSQVECLVDLECIEQ